MKDILITVSEGLVPGSPAYTIREEVFVDEQGFLDEFDSLDETALQIVVYRNQVAIACGRAYEERERPGVYHLGRVAVHKPYRHQGFGSIVMDALEEAASKAGAREFILQAQLQALSFYASLGYEPFGEEHLVEHCPHIMMRKMAS